MNQQPPPIQRTPSAAIQYNTNRLLELVEAERNGAIASLTPQIIDIQKRLIQFQDRLASGPIDPDVLKELANLQDRFSGFVKSAGILDANVSRVNELEATIAQLRVDNHGLLASNSNTIRDYTVAREEEEKTRKALESLKKQLGTIGMGQRNDGRLAFSPEWKILLEEVGKLGLKAPGQFHIATGIATLAARLRSEREATAGPTSPTKNHPMQPIEIIDLMDDEPIPSTSGPQQFP